MDEEYMDRPNIELGNVCKNLFFFNGNIGLYELGKLLSCPTKEFEEYLSALEKETSMEEEREL